MSLYEIKHNDNSSNECPVQNIMREKRLKISMEMKLEMPMEMK